MFLVAWLLENTLAAAVGYYVGRYLSVQDRDRLRQKALAAQTKAAHAAADARALTQQAAVEGEWESLPASVSTSDFPEFQ